MLKRYFHNEFKHINFVKNENIILNKSLEMLKKYDNRMNSHYLRTWDMNISELKTIYYCAKVLQSLHILNKSTKIFQHGIAVSDFRDHSTRTRAAYVSAASMLGLSLMDFDTSKSQVEHGETVRESAVMLTFLADAMGIRHDLYLGEGHNYMKQVANALKERYHKQLSPGFTSLVNLQCDHDHPTQSMADLMHLSRQFNGLENLKGKKIAVTWAYSPSYGKPLSVPQGLIALLPRFGMEVVYAHPPGYDLFPDNMIDMNWLNEQSNIPIKKVDTMDEAFLNADVVYPKSWAPLHIMNQRTKYYREGNATHEKLKTLEKECIEHNDKYRNWTCTNKLMSTTNNALYMHCLPADITNVSCKYGEVDADVFESQRLQLYQQAYNKPFVIGAAISTSTFSNNHIANIFKRPQERCY